MYGHFPVNSRFTVLFLSQLPITRSVKLRLFFTVYACKNAYLGSFFIPEKYVIRVLFVSPWTSLIPPLAIRVLPRELNDDQIFFSCTKIHYLLGLRGYCTPDQFFDCLCIFLKSYNTLVTSKICFLQVTFQGTQLLHWNFTKSSGY